MCGIAGLYNAGGLTDRDVVDPMVAALHHRGPDDRGRFVSSRIALGMTRLAIIDLAGGRQPLTNEDGSVTVVCNGEIYNHRELRDELSRRGHVLRTGSDVEVIAHLYEELGPGCVGRLRGMFAIALWDEPRQRLLLARDRLGIKPLFYAVRGSRLVFGSELKALARSGVLNLQIDRRALDRYLTFGYIPPPSTIYQDVQKLEPGHLMVCEAGQITTERYWRLRFEPAADVDEKTLSRRFMGLFSDAVRSHLMSDVSIGAFLSGGIDSSLVVALMRECVSGPIKTFTIGFGGRAGGYLDERAYAREVSRQYGTDHEEFEVQPDLEQTLDEVVDAFDEPFADDSVVPTLHICRLARSRVTVALTGLGGDELFGGYERYLGLMLSRRYCRLPQFVRRRLVEALVARLPERRDGHYTINHLKRFVRSAELPEARRYLDYVSIFNDAMKGRICQRKTWADRAETAHEATKYFDSPYATDALERALYHDFHTYLPEDILALSDRLSMRYGLELRVPFLDHPLVEFCATIPSSMKIRSMTKKYLLRRVARPLLPPAVLRHRKQGFASPMSAWLRTDLKKYLEDTLSPRRLARHGLFDPSAVRQLIDAHTTRQESHDRQLFALMMFQKWHERFM